MFSSNGALPLWSVPSGTPPLPSKLLKGKHAQASMVSPPNPESHQHLQAQVPPPADAQPATRASVCPCSACSLETLRPFVSGLHTCELPACDALGPLGSALGHLPCGPLPGMPTDPGQEFN